MGLFLIHTLGSQRDHLQLNKQVAVALVSNQYLQRLAEADRYRAKVQTDRRDPNQSITSRSTDAQLPPNIDHSSE